MSDVYLNLALFASIALSHKSKIDNDHFGQWLVTYGNRDMRASGLVDFGRCLCRQSDQITQIRMWINQVKNRNAVCVCQQIRKVEVIILTWIEISVGQFSVEK